MTDLNNSYLGDGVYLSFDGYQLWLAVGEHTNKIVALEPDVFINLITQGKRMLGLTTISED